MKRREDRRGTAPSSGTAGHASAQHVRCFEAAPDAYDVAYVPLETVAVGALDALRARTGLALDASGLNASDPAWKP